MCFSIPKLLLHLHGKLEAGDGCQNQKGACPIASTAFSGRWSRDGGIGDSMPLNRVAFGALSFVH